MKQEIRLIRTGVNDERIKAVKQTTYESGRKEFRGLFSMTQEQALQFGKMIMDMTTTEGVEELSMTLNHFENPFEEKQNND